MLPGPLVYVKGQGHSEKSNLGCGDPSAVILSSSALILSSSALNFSSSAVISLCSIQCQYLVVNVCHCLYQWLTVRVRLSALMSVKASVSSTFAKYPLCEWFHYFANFEKISQSILVSTVCYFAKARRAFSQSILVSTVCYFAKVNDFSQSILVSTVCYFAKARRAFSQSILVSTVCVSVCLFVCLSVTPPTGHSFAPIKIIFLP